jgi:hypothetical protein
MKVVLLSLKFLNDIDLSHTALMVVIGLQFPLSTLRDGRWENQLYDTDEAVDVLVVVEGINLHV